MADEQLGQVTLEVRVDQAALDAGLTAAKGKIDAFREAAVQSLQSISSSFDLDIDKALKQIQDGTRKAASGARPLQPSTGTSTSASGGRIGGQLFAEAERAARSIDGLEDRLNRLRASLRGVDVGSKEFRNLQGEIRRVESQLDSAAKSGARFSTALSKLSDLAIVARAAVDAVRAITQSLAGLASAIITTAGEAQKLQAAFQALTGSKAAAEDLRNTLFQLSKTTPFRNDDILETSRRLLAVGVGADKLEGTVNRIGALAAQSGQDLGRIGLIYSQIFAKGRLQGEENLQLLEAGIDLTGKLKTVTGLQGEAFRKAMETGKIGLAEVNAAITLATGSMDALIEGGKAVDVAFNNIGDNVQQVFLGFSKAVAPALSATFNVVNKAFEELFPNLEAIDALFAPLTREAERFAKALEANPQVVSTLAAAFENLLQFGINGAVEGIQTINDQLEQRPEGLLKTITEIELAIRKTILRLQALNTAAGAVLTGTQKGLFSPEAQAQFKESQRLFQLAADQKPIEIPIVAKPKGAAAEVAGPPDQLDNKGQQSLAASRERQKQVEQQINALYANRSISLAAQSEIAEQITQQSQRQEKILTAQLQLDQARENLAKAQPRKDGTIDPRAIQAVTDATAALGAAQREVNAELVKERALLAEKAKDISRLKQISSIYADQALTFEQQEAAVGRLNAQFERQDKLLQRAQVYQESLRQLAQYADRVQRGLEKFDPSIQASLEINAEKAKLALIEAGESVRQNLLRGASEAAQKLLEASKAFGRAQDAAFELLNPDAQRQRVNEALRVINQGLSNPDLGLSTDAVNRKIADGTFSSLRGVADTVQSLQDGYQGLQKAIQDNVQAQKDLTGWTKKVNETIANAGKGIGTAAEKVTKSQDSLASTISGVASSISRLPDGVSKLPGNAYRLNPDNANITSSRGGTFFNAAGDVIDRGGNAIPTADNATIYSGGGLSALIGAVAAANDPTGSYANRTDAQRRAAESALEVQRLNAGQQIYSNTRAGINNGTLGYTPPPPPNPLQSAAPLPLQVNPQIVNGNQDLAAATRSLAGATGDLVGFLTNGTYVTVNIPAGATASSNQEIRYE